MPMYFADGFVTGLEKEFPDGSSYSGTIESPKHRTAQFLRDAGVRIKKIEKVRKANEDDPTQTPESRAVNTFKYAKEQFAEIEKQQKSLPDLPKLMNDISQDMDQIFVEKASTPFAKEARQRLSSLPEAERIKFSNELIKNEDYNTASYILGAPAFLSGIPDDHHKQLKSQFQQRVFPEDMATLKALNSLHTHAEKGKKAVERIFRETKAMASLNDALGKSETAKNLMSQ